MISQFVISTGTGVHGFTLDPSLGEFILTHPDIKVFLFLYYFSNIICTIFCNGLLISPRGLTWRTLIVIALKESRAEIHRRNSASFISKYCSDIRVHYLITYYIHIYCPKKFCVRVARIYIVNVYIVLMRMY